MDKKQMTFISRLINIAFIDDGILRGSFPASVFDQIVTIHNTEKKKFALECVPSKEYFIEILREVEEARYEQRCLGIKPTSIEYLANICREHMLKRIEEGK